LSSNLISIIDKFTLRTLFDFPKLQEGLSFSPRAIPTITADQLKQELAHVKQLFLATPERAKKLYQSDSIRYWFLFPFEEKTYLYIHTWQGVPHCHGYCKCEYSTELFQIFCDM
jgi:hypothetical protein